MSATEKREARRTAQGVARERLAGPLISSVGELGIALAERGSASLEVEDARLRGREHLRRARAQARAWVTDAQCKVKQAEDEYRKAHTSALTAGWSAAALTDMGFSPAQERGRPRRRSHQDPGAVQHLPGPADRRA